MLNPLFIALTGVYFTTRSQLIAALFPPAVYYPSLALMLLGSLGLLYELMHTCVEEAEHARGGFGLVRYMLMAQLMWLWMSRSTYIAVFELVTGKRAWHKTPHGHAEVGDAGFRHRPLPHQSTPPGRQPTGRPHSQPGHRLTAPVAQRSFEDMRWAESA